MPYTGDHYFIILQKILKNDCEFIRRNCIVPINTDTINALINGLDKKIDWYDPELSYYYELGDSKLEISCYAYDKLAVKYIITDKSKKRNKSTIYKFIITLNDNDELTVS